MGYLALTLEKINKIKFFLLDEEKPEHLEDKMGKMERLLEEGWEVFRYEEVRNDYNFLKVYIVLIQRRPSYLKIAMEEWGLAQQATSPEATSVNEQPDLSLIGAELPPGIKISECGEIVSEHLDSNPGEEDNHDIIDDVLDALDSGEPVTEPTDFTEGTQPADDNVDAPEPAPQTWPCRKNNLNNRRTLKSS